METRSAKTPGTNADRSRAARMDGVVVFDGTCGLCVRCVRFILRHESAPTLRFASIQSRAGGRLLREFGSDAQAARTFVLIADGKAYLKSGAAIRVASGFRGPWKLLGAIRLIPRPIRDWGYDVVARNRTRWFGRLDACLVPGPDLKARFLDE